MFEKVSRLLKYDSNFFLSTNIYMDTSPDHFTPLALRVRGNDGPELLVLVYHSCASADVIDTKQNIKAIGLSQYQDCSYR